MTRKDLETSLKLYDTFTISKFPLFSDILDKADRRLLEFLQLQEYELLSIYEGTKVNIPEFEGSSFFITKYFQVIKKPGDPFYRKDQRDNEIGVTIEGGWKGYDTEVIINLFIRGKDVMSAKYKVSAEILKSGGADMILKWNGKTLTNFKKKVHKWFCVIQVPIDKVWIDDLKIFK